MKKISERLGETRRGCEPHGQGWGASRTGRDGRGEVRAARAVGAVRVVGAVGAVGVVRAVGVVEVVGAVGMVGVVRAVGGVEDGVRWEKLGGTLRHSERLEVRVVIEV